MSEPSPTRLGVFAKYWQPGAVKTRLAADVGEPAAADLYRQFLITTLRRLEQSAETRVLCYSPPDHEPDFRQIAPDGWQLAPQTAGDLGARMKCFFEPSGEDSYCRTVLIGSDTPNVPVGCIEQAFAALLRQPVVLGPSGDGGYYLIGIRGAAPAMFDAIDWSTPSVWQQTVDRLKSLGLHYRNGYATVPAWHDVDTLDDLRRLADQLAAAPPCEALQELAQHVQCVLVGFEDHTK